MLTFSRVEIVSCNTFMILANVTHLILDHCFPLIMIFLYLYDVIEERKITSKFLFTIKFVFVVVVVVAIESDIIGF